MNPNILSEIGKKNNMTNANKLGNLSVSPVGSLGDSCENILQEEYM